MKNVLKKAMGCFLSIGILISCICVRAHATELPILMYHNLTTDATETNSMTITQERFRLDMEFLQEYGYTPLLPADLIAIYEGTIKMPDKPVMVTFDDGYVSNYTLGYPVLQNTGMKAVIALITANIQTQESRPQDSVFLTWEEVRELSDSGIIEIGLHTHNLHNPQYGGATAPDGINGVHRLSGETKEAYEVRVGADLQTGVSLIRQNTGVQTINYFSYPFGACDRWMEGLLKEQGIRMTTSTNAKTADIKTGLLSLPRYGICMDKSVAQLLSEKTTAKASELAVVLDGKQTMLPTYKIDGSNYVRVRDVAGLLSDTDFGFDVIWNAGDECVELHANQSYRRLGTEFAALKATRKTVTPLAKATVVDGTEKMMAAYVIDGNTFYKLRSIAGACDFTVTWDESTQRAMISQ